MTVNHAMQCQINIWIIPTCAYVKVVTLVMIKRKDACWAS